MKKKIDTGKSLVDIDSLQIAVCKSFVILPRLQYIDSSDMMSPKIIYCPE